jgi:hypothetical protein
MAQLLRFAAGWRRHNHRMLNSLSSDAAKMIWPARNFD